MLKNQKINLYYLFFITVFVISCAKDTKQDLFEISSKKIGSLTPDIKISQLDSIYKNDSIVRNNMNSSLLNNNSTIEIYEKGGEKLLILEPADTKPDPTIAYIQVIDPRYHTKSGISNTSIYKDIKEKYNISKINNLLSTVVIFVDSIQATFTIDKKELPAALRAGTSAKIEASQIPDTAKIKHFMISWDKN